MSANHVFLLEPTLNPALELQAVNRVHRLGQTRATVVHRLLVDDTIETAISAQQEQLRTVCWAHSVTVTALTAWRAGHRRGGARCVPRARGVSQ